MIASAATRSAVAAHQRAPRRERAASERNFFGVALDVVDRLERHAEPFGNELRKRRGVALAVGMGAGDDRHHAAGIEPDFHALVENTAELDIGRDGASAQLAAPLAVLAARRKAFPVGGRQAHVHQLLELAAIVSVMRRRVIGQRLGRDEIAPPQFDPVDPRDLRRALDQALDQIDRFRPAGASIDRGRRSVGEDGVGADMDGLYVVKTWNEHDRPEQRSGRGAPPVGAERLIGVRADGEELAVLVEREFAVDDLVARMIVAEQAFAARRRPFDRPAATLRRPQHQNVFGIEIGLHAEAAADIGRDHPDFRLRHMKHIGRQRCTHAVRILRRGVERQSAVSGVIQADGAAWLDRVCGDAIVDQPDRYHVLRRGEGGIRRRLVAERDGHADIAVRDNPARFSALAALSPSSRSTTAGNGS